MQSVEHFFISYSRADGETFARRVAEALAPLPVWRDDQIHPGQSWPRALEQAIGNCRALLFLMTRDSVSTQSTCEAELMHALNCKKPVLPLRIHGDAPLPLLINTRQYVDFTGSFDAAAAKLRAHLAWLDSPAGHLHALEERIADAQAELAHGANARLDAELAELRRRREELRRIVEDPEAAREAVRASVAAAQERERGISVNQPPLVAPSWFQNRDAQTARLDEFLDDESLRLLTVAGRGGAGKSTLVCRVLRSLGGVVYLSNAQARHRVTLPDLYAGLVTLLPEEAAARVDAVYRDPRAPVRETVQALAEAFADRRAIVLLDNFEDALDPETSRLRDAALDEALRALLELPPHGVKVILTTRVVPRELLMVQPSRQRRLDLDAGLASPYAENLLRAMDADGTVGLRDAPDALLDAARKRTRGLPRAMEYLFGILSADRSTTLGDVLESTSGVLPEAVMQVLVGEAFSRLDPLAQRVMQALAVYGAPVPQEAVDHLLQLSAPGVRGREVLARLVNMQLVRFESRRYSLHPVDRDYALGLMERASLNALRLGAAEWFAGARKPPESWKSLVDLAPQLAEFDLRCDAQDYDHAAPVLIEVAQQLFVWGHHQLLIGRERRLQGKITRPDLAAVSLAILGAALSALGNLDEATLVYEEAAGLAREHEPVFEISILGALASLELARFRIHAAIDALLQNIARRQALPDPAALPGITDVVVSLANAYLQIGRVEEAHRFTLGSVEYMHNLGQREAEAGHLCVLASVQIDLGQWTEARRSCEQALALAGELGYRAVVVNARLILAAIDLAEERWDEAERTIEESIVLCDELGVAEWQKMARETAGALHLYRGESSRARAMFDAARRYDTGAPRPYSSVVLGIIELYQHDVAAAKTAFTKAIAQAEQLLAITPELYAAHDAVGFACCGLALCGERARLEDATHAFARARAISRNPGTVRGIVQLFDALAQADGDGILSAVRPSVSGSA
jgi:tetratricopeptide (TPR) repeat protein